MFNTASHTNNSPRALRPRLPDIDTVKAFGRLLGKIAEPLATPGAILVTPILTDGQRTHTDDINDVVADFDRAIQDQEFWADRQ